MLDLLTILSDQKEELQNTDVSLLITRREESLFNLKSKRAQVVIGVRRCGKSTICKKVLIESNINFAYVNFDDERLMHFKIDDMNSVMETLYRIYGDFDCLLLDEIQNVEGWHLFVNRIMRGGMKVVLTGSNANLLSGELATHLTGRYNQISLYPFSFVDFCVAKGVDVSSASTKSKALRQRSLDEYLSCGGFPEIIDGEEKKEYVMSLLSAIIQKDICRRYKINRTQTLWEIANNLIDKNCQEISYNVIQRQFDIGSVHTVKNYVSYLNEAFLLRTVSKFSTKSSDRLLSKKSYVTDMAFISDREDVVMSQNLGWRLENAVYLELLRRINSEYQQIYYLRKTNLFEVDFVIYEGSRILELIQVTYMMDKSNKKLYKREIDGLIKGAQLTKCERLTLVCLEGENEILDVGEHKIKVVKASEWLCNYTE